VASGGTSSPATSVFGSLLGSLGNLGGNSGSMDSILDVLGGFLSGTSDRQYIADLNSSNSNFLKSADTHLSVKDSASYISMNFFDPANLVWDESNPDRVTMSLSEKQWELVHSLDQNIFYDDGSGYIDLGLDNVYDFTSSGDLIADTKKTWLSINGQPVAYYHEDTTESGNDYCITGRVPAILNGTRVNLWLVFDNENPKGFVAGAQYDYQEKATKTVAKNLTKLEKGDKIDFLCDYYAYDGSYMDSYYLGEQMTVGDSIVISNTDIGKNKALITYRFTDIYNQAYWSPAIER
jgi:hypothetical protein